MQAQSLTTASEDDSKAPPKQSQQVNATYRNIVWHNMLSAFGHGVAMFCGM